MKANRMEDLIGNTPLVRYQSAEVPASTRIWIKLEGFNPTGSIKDRACIYNIRDAEKAGSLKPGMTLLDASSGNMACALAYWGKILGYPVKVVCGSKLTLDKKQFILYFGAELVMKGDFTIEGNKHCREDIAPTDKKYYFLDQLHNPSNPKSSYETLGPEILKDLPELKAVFGSLGSGGSMTGTAKFMAEQNRGIECFSVEAKTGIKLPGTGTFVDGDYITPFIAEAFEKNLFKTRVSITLEGAMKRTAELAQQGVFVGFQTGGVLEAALETVKKQAIEGDVVVVSGDSGWKNIDKLMATLK